MNTTGRLIRYEIRVLGGLDARWSAWFAGLEVTGDAAGETTLSGPLPDQAALHGVLARVRDLGLPLIAVRRLDPDPRDACEMGPRTDRIERTNGMRKIINSTYISLDGVIESPQNWPSSDVDDDTANAIQAELLFACDAVLMGRRTYDGFAPVWPTRSGDPVSDRINSMPKYVVSSTLRKPEWNNTTVISGDPVAQIKGLKAQPGKDIVQYGFGQLSYTLMEHDLLDELRLWVHPFFVGSGGPQDLLYRASPLTRLDLLDTKPLKTGIVILTYQPRRTAAAKS